MSINAVLFDLHETLVTTEVSVSDEEISMYLSGRGYEVSPQQLKAAWMFTSFVDYPKHGYKDWRTYLKSALERLDVEVDGQTMDGLVQLMERCGLRLYSDAEEAVKRAKEQGLKTAVVTTIARFKFQHALQPLEEHLDYIMTGYEAGCDKSDPRMYKRLLEILNLKAEETVIVGDDMGLDVLLPKKLGLNAILLDRGGKQQTATEPDAIARSLTEAMDLIQDLWPA